MLAGPTGHPPTVSGYLSVRHSSLHPSHNPRLFHRVPSPEMGRFRVPMDAVSDSHVADENGRIREEIGAMGVQETRGDDEENSKIIEKLNFSIF